MKTPARSVGVDILRVMRAPAILSVVALALLTSLASATSARAAPTNPAGTAETIVATDGAVQLRVSDERGQLCLELRTEHTGAGSCGDPVLGAVAVTAASSAIRYAGIVAPERTTTVELRGAGTLLASAPTISGDAYTGEYAGSVRFALVRLPRGVHVHGLRVRALDATGALVSVIAPNDGNLPFDRRRLLSGRYGPTRWSIEGSQWSALTPSVVDLAHESILRCVLITIGGGGPPTTDAGRCVGGAPRDRFSVLVGDATVSSEGRCAPQFRLLHGIVEGPLRAVTFLLGDGRRRSARLAPLGDGQRLEYALAVPHDAAVRNVTFDRGAAGSQVRPLGMAPLTISCATSGEGGTSDPGWFDRPGLFDDPAALTPVGPVTEVAGSPAFRVADGPGESLCVALGDRPFDGLGCDVVSPALGAPVSAVDSFVTPHSIVVALPSRVAAIRIATSDGKITRMIPTVDAPGYAGIYAGAVRFASATVAATRELAVLDLLDLAGNVLHRERDNVFVGQNTALRFVGRRRLAGGAGGPSLWQTVLRGDATKTRCLALTNGPPPRHDERCQAQRTPTSLLISSSCVSHRLTVAVTAEPGVRVRVGRRTIRIRRGAGVFTLPSKRALASVTFVRHGTASRFAIDAPSGARQCGWNASPGNPLARLRR